MVQINSFAKFHSFFNEFSIGGRLDRMDQMDGLLGHVRRLWPKEADAELPSWHWEMQVGQPFQWELIAQFRAEALPLSWSAAQWRHARCRCSRRDARADLWEFFIIFLNDFPGDALPIDATIGFWHGAELWLAAASSGRWQWWVLETIKWHLRRFNAAMLNFGRYR